ncbi:MAG: hypothetical protein K5920_11955 [Bacteroidales bacterium]|nr:hypothetical protein [Bacteroidales bacterium]
MMEIKQLEPKEKIITFFSEIKGSTVETAIKDIAKINASEIVHELVFYGLHGLYAVARQFGHVPVAIPTIQQRYDFLEKGIRLFHYNS